MANWSSIVSGRKQSASDLFSVPNIVYPSPKPIPGTPHQLYPTPGSPSLQRFASSSQQSSPGWPSSSSGSGSTSVSSSQRSPWFPNKPKSRRASGSSAESACSKNTSVSGILTPQSRTKNDQSPSETSPKKRYPSGEQKEPRVTFVITESESSTNTGSEESGFSEKTEKTKCASYADVCSKCMESMETKPQVESQRGRSHHQYGHNVYKGHQQQGHYQPRQHRGSYRGNQRPQSAETYRRGYQDYHQNENYRGHRGRGQGQRGDRGYRGRNRGNLRLNSGHYRERRPNIGNEYQRSFSEPKPDLEKLTNSLTLDEKSKTSSANIRHRQKDDNKKDENS